MYQTANSKTVSQGYGIYMISVTAKITETAKMTVTANILANYVLFLVTFYHLYFILSKTI